jgi:peptidoglycan/xylan/chitin deacetylase (PgdA/CDA1 family)
MSNFNIPILMYHSIQSMPRSTLMRSLHVPPKRFAFQMWMLKLLGYKALSLKNLKPYLSGEKRGKVVGLTFDDGYQNNLTYAAPVLLKYNFSATCYIVSNCIGLSNIWDMDQGIAQMPLMNENEINEWLSLGMDIGAHTRTHIDLTKASEKVAYNEINGSKVDLEKKFNTSITDFCYPFGRFNHLLAEVVKSSGYNSSTTMLRGRVNSKTDSYKIPRIPINHHTLPHLFLSKILTKYEDKR